MKRLAVILATVALAICAATAVYGDSINFSESWYIRITNFSLGSGADFNQPQTFHYSSTSLIEPKLLDQNTSTSRFGTLYFDFHAGQVSSSDLAFFVPLATVGGEWSDTISFDWATNVTDPRIAFRLSNGDPLASWYAPSGTDYRTGHVTLLTGTYNQSPPSFSVSIAAVPEPPALASMVIGLSSFGCLLRYFGLSMSIFVFQALPCSAFIRRW